MSPVLPLNLERISLDYVAAANSNKVSSTVDTFPSGKDYKGRTRINPEGQRSAGYFMYLLDWANILTSYYSFFYNNIQYTTYAL